MLSSRSYGYGQAGKDGVDIYRWETKPCCVRLLSCIEIVSRGICESKNGSGLKLLKTRYLEKKLWRPPLFLFPDKLAGLCVFAGLCLTRVLWLGESFDLIGMLRLSG